jgi:NAD-dependent protein deacetylase/lipoamidase
MDLNKEIERAAEVFKSTRKLVTFSGAGMSAESGIPTFRDPGGIWDQFDPEEVGTGPGLLNTLSRMPEKVKAFVGETIRVFLQARPNPGHLALGTLEKIGILRSVITQNVDNLHQEAGNQNVIEMHGNLFRQRCLACGAKKAFGREQYLGMVRSALEQLKQFDLPSIVEILPKCACGNPMRPDVVMFGEAVQGLYESFREAEDCEAMLVLGTSGVVYPAAALPQRAKQSGATVIEINPGQSAYYSVADIRLRGRTGEILPQIVKRIQNA